MAYAAAMASPTFSGTLTQGEQVVLHANYTGSDLTITVQVRLVKGGGDPARTTAILRILKDAHDPEGKPFTLKNDHALLSVKTEDQHLINLYAEANIEFTVFVH